MTGLLFSLAPLLEPLARPSELRSQFGLARGRGEQPAQDLGLVAYLVLQGLVGPEGTEQPTGDAAYGGKLVLVEVRKGIGGENGRRRLPQGHVSLHVRGVLTQHLGGVVKVPGDVFACSNHPVPPVVVLVLVVIDQCAGDLGHDPVDPGFVGSQDDQLFVFEAMTDPGRDEHLDETAPGLVVPQVEPVADFVVFGPGLELRQRRGDQPLTTAVAAAPAVDLVPAPGAEPDLVAHAAPVFALLGSTGAARPEPVAAASCWAPGPVAFISSWYSSSTLTDHTS